MTPVIHISTHIITDPAKKSKTNSNRTYIKMSRRPPKISSFNGAAEIRNDADKSGRTIRRICNAYTRRPYRQRSALVILHWKHSIAGRSVTRFFFVSLLVNNKGQAVTSNNDWNREFGMCVKAHCRCIRIPSMLKGLKIQRIRIITYVIVHCSWHLLREPALQLNVSRLSIIYHRKRSANIWWKKHKLEFGIVFRYSWPDNDNTKGDSTLHSASHIIYVHTFQRSRMCVWVAGFTVQKFNS